MIGLLGGKLFMFGELFGKCRRPDWHQTAENGPSGGY